MTKKDLLTIAIKVFGFYILVTGIGTFPIIGITINSVKEDPQGIWYILIGLLPFLILIGVSIYFIKQTSSIVNWISQKDIEDENSRDINVGAIDKETIQEFVFSGIGLFVIVKALPRLTQTIINLIRISWEKSSGLNVWISFIGLIIEIVIGVYLIFGSDKLVMLLKKLKETKSSSNNE